MELNFHIGNRGVRVEVFALNIERTKGTKNLKFMERNLTWLKPNNLKLMGMEFVWLKPE